MRACWIDAGNNPNPAQLDAHGVRMTLWPANDLQTTGAHIDAWRDRYAQGIYLARNWYNTDPASFARIADQEVTRCGGNGQQLAVDFNPEPFNASYILALLGTWRMHRPARDTRLSIEWNKGALMTPDLLNAINSDVHLIVQEEAFDGDMTPHDPDEARSDLVNYGVRRDRAVPCYDAARLGAKWDGVAFTQGRLK